MTLDDLHAGGSVEAAFAIFFSTGPSSAAGAGRSDAGGSAASAGPRQGKVSRLRDLLGRGVSDRYLERLLIAAKGAVEEAIELHFSGKRWTSMGSQFLRVGSDETYNQRVLTSGTDFIFKC